MPITLSAAAEKRLEALRVKREKPQLYLRVTVEGGGCQGFEYHFSFADAPEGDDWFAEGADFNVGVTTDPTSHDLLDGSTIDYTDELVGARFVVVNPNATSSCGCGTSFNIA